MPIPEVPGRVVGRWSVLVGLVLSGWLLLTPLLVRGEPSRDAGNDVPRGETVRAAGNRNDRNWEKLKSMSASERERILRNLQRFRELPDEKKWELRQLRADLQEDGKQNGQLSRVMDNYFEWLKTLTPGQRSDLADQTDSARRRKLVAELMLRQQKASDTATPRRRRLPMDPAVLEKFFTVLAEELQSKGYVSEADLTARTGLPRYFFVLRRGFSGNFPPEWLSPEFGERLLVTLPDPAQRSILRDPDPRVRLSRMLAMIGLSLQQAVRDQEDQIPGEELEKFFVEMTGEQQDDVMLRPYSEQDRRLRQLYMKAHGREQAMAGGFPPVIQQFIRGQLARSQGLFGAGRPGGGPGSGSGGGPANRDGTPVRATPGRGAGFEDDFDRRRPGAPVGGGGPGGGPGPGRGRPRPPPPTHRSPSRRWLTTVSRRTGQSRPPVPPVVQPPVPKATLSVTRSARCRQTRRSTTQPAGTLSDPRKPGPPGAGGSIDCESTPSVRSPAVDSPASDTGRSPDDLVGKRPGCQSVG